MFFPEEYRALADDELEVRIRRVKGSLGRRLLILGHYYQQDAVIKCADVTGDSYALAKAGAAARDAEYIVFCGVRFMAETADLLSAPAQRVYMPDPDAGCPLADLADLEQVERAWRMLEQIGVARDVMPVTYINSSMELKAFCGRQGGTVCTSSSAGEAFDWALKQRSKIFFFPDENLGRVSAYAKGFNDGDMVVWDATERDGGVDPDRLKNARIILWNGYCHVHTFFTVSHVEAARAKYPGCLVAVHPECNPSVVSAADMNGSTSMLIDYVERAPQGSTVVVGTEINLVSRLATMFADKKVVPLARSLCPNMFKTSLRDLCYTLEHFPEDRRIAVPDYLRADAHLALERMLKLK